MANFHSQSPGKNQNKNDLAKDDSSICQAEKLERYRAFMTGYVKRINEATFNVAIGGVRIGLAKYSRLAQINLNNRIITFSRYAIENVPERGRRYLVLHELAHVKEASHNKRFWQLVGQYEPDYRQIGKSLEKAFKQNVRQEEKGIEEESFFSFAKTNSLLPSGNAGTKTNVFQKQPLDQESLAKLEEKSYLSQVTNNIVQTSFTCIDEDEILNILAQEKESDQPIRQIYETELDDILDWTC